MKKCTITWKFELCRTLLKAMTCFNVLGQFSNKLSIFSSPEPLGILVIFSWTQIGRFGFSDREIGVSNREIFSRQKIFNFSVKKL